ncbi:ABC transporter permease [Neorhizobium alkalisoli]|uniref:Peptide/nickel transport system permease protein n=1 Tax=Neorhizobium alkalisoli TaxID=528178 RepID=A0A561R8X1_9HYPH|nr:ABC transporter permease [Neorhizobium alkalisoli]TWF59082.1 peptide/nickel transport system permease protein [Neorhizobium alkalisoli]
MRWLAFLMNRLIWLIPTLFALVTLIFILSRVMPIDPAILIAGENASHEQIEQVRNRFSLDKPLISQFAGYLKAVATGDLGDSLYTRQPVAQDLRSRLPATIELTIVSLLIAAVFGIPSGVLCGVYSNSLLDHALRIGVVAFAGLTHFWIAIQFQIIFSMNLDWLPLAGRIGDVPLHDFTGFVLLDSLLAADWQALASAIAHITLPALTIGLPTAAVVQRFTRNSVMNMMDTPFLRYQEAMGLSRGIIIWKYLLRSSLAATVTLFGLTAGIMLAGVVTVETIFDWPGTGNYAVRSIMYSDYNAVMGFTLLAGTLFVLLSVSVDIIQALIDPRGVT